MRKTNSLLALLFALTVASPLVGQNPAPTVDPEKIRAHVKFLASDLLEGRGTGQRGGDIAAEYIATQFELDGLKPAGENGAYFQDVPMTVSYTHLTLPTICSV